MSATKAELRRLRKPIRFTTGELIDLLNLIHGRTQELKMPERDRRAKIAKLYRLRRKLWKV